MSRIKQYIPKAFGACTPSNPYFNSSTFATWNAAVHIQCDLPLCGYFQDLPDEILEQSIVDFLKSEYAQYGGYGQLDGTYEEFEPYVNIREIADMIRKFRTMVRWY